VPNQKKLDWRSLACVQPNMHQPGVHRTVRCGPIDERFALGNSPRAPQINSRDCLVCTGLSGEPTAPAANGRQRDQRATRGPSQRSLSRTGLSGVRQTVSGAPRGPKVQQSASLEKKEIGHRTGTVHVRWCTGLSGAPPDRRQELPSKWDSNGS
jgi:hypothetical protein